MGDRHVGDAAQTPAAAGGPRERGGGSGLAHFLVRLWREKPLGTAGGVVVLALILVAIFADVLAPYPFDAVNLRALLQPPAAEHLMGTDQLGRDYLSRNIHGARISMFVGLLATSLNVVAGAVARPVPDPDRLQPQHVRRRRPRPARPAPPGRRRPSRNPRRPCAANAVRSPPVAPVSIRGRSRR